MRGRVCVLVRDISLVSAWRRVILLLYFSLILATPHGLLSVIVFVLFDVVIQ